MNSLRFSIITPSYNQGTYLEETIQSVINQDYKNFEFFIIDGGSNDQSLDIIKKYSQQIDFWVSEKDEGQSHAINKGMARASGDILIWINSDDQLVAGALQKVAQYFLRNPTVDVVHGKTILFSVETNSLVKGANEKFLPEQYLAGMAFPQPSAFIRRSAMLTVCPRLNPSLHYGMDYDLFAQLFLNGNFLSVPDVFSKYRLHSSSKTVLTNQSFAEDWQQIFCMVLKAIDQTKEFEEHLKEMCLWKESENSYSVSKSFDRDFIQKAFLYFLDFQINFYYRDLKFSQVIKIAHFLEKNYPLFYIQQNIKRIQRVSRIPFAKRLIPLFRKTNF